MHFKIQLERYSEERWLVIESHSHAIKNWHYGTVDNLLLEFRANGNNQSFGLVPWSWGWDAIYGIYFIVSEPAH